VFAVAAGLLLIGGAIASGALVSYLEERLYQDEIVFAKNTPYQRLIVTRWHEDVRLFLNGHLQFSSVDEYRYHETLVHPAMGLAARRGRVLILGGGDGLAAREVLKYPEIERVDVVDIDPEVTGLFSANPLLIALNKGSLRDPRVHVHNVDAMSYLRSTTRMYDVVLMDLPDPSDASLGKLYSRTFFSLVGRRLADGGLMSSQCTSPFRSRKAFWCIVETVRASYCGPAPDARFRAQPYHTVVPTFGTWGFVVAGREAPDLAKLKIEVPTRYLTTELAGSLAVFPPDMGQLEAPVSTLDNPVVCRLYRQGYHKYME